MYSNCKVLVTGGQGFLGCYVTKNLLAKKCQVTLLDVKPDDHILKQVFSLDQISKLDRKFLDIFRKN